MIFTSGRARGEKRIEIRKEKKRNFENWKSKNQWQVYLRQLIDGKSTLQEYEEVFLEIDYKKYKANLDKVIKQTQLVIDGEKRRGNCKYTREDHTDESIVVFHIENKTNSFDVTVEPDITSREILIVTITKIK